ncbi:MAG: putative lipotransrane domain protein, partial [Gammaproteobacteria bacterium]|nr:putative lipotransrane domain protein [Gammaproteobacteria bacterium]
MGMLSGCPIVGGGKFTVGGTLTGLRGSGLVLQLNGGDDLSFSANGGFAFGTRLGDGAAYAVTVKTQP